MTAPALPAPNALERVIRRLSPGWAVKRQAAELKLRAYEAASPRDTWKPRRSGASADADHRADASILRNKARALKQNVPYIAAAMAARVAMRVGTGIVPRFLGTGADRLNALHEDWAKVCDADGRCDLYGLQRLAADTMDTDGEVLIRLRYRRPEDGLPVPLQLQILEIDWLDSARNQSAGAGGTGTGNIIVNGIEYDAIGRVAAYWLWDQHPGDATVRRATRTQSRRVPADQIIHLYASNRPGQGRGITLLAPVIARVRDTQLLEDAHLARRNLEARLSVLVSGDASQMANPHQFGGTTDSASPQIARTTGDLGELASGSITELPPGLNVDTISPVATPGHVEDVKHNIHIVTACLAVTYEQATGDMSGVNFSSARVRQIDVRRQAEQDQWLVLIPNLIARITTAFAYAAELAGKVEVSATPRKVDYSTPKWDYVNPQQEVRADNEEIASGLSSLSEKLRRRGYKPDDVFAEIGSDFEKLAGTKVGDTGMSALDVLLFLQKGKTADEPDAQAAADNTKRTLDAQATAIAQLSARQEATERRSIEVNVAPAAVSVQPPEVNVNVERSDVHVDVQPANVTAQIRNDGAVVHVPAADPPVVNVTAQAAAPEVRVVNHVQPAPVTVTATRPHVTEVERDKAGRIVRTTQREQ